jgi:hypothetical protein
VFRPTIDITLQLADLTWTVRALIDTGAPLTIFDRGAADALAVDFEKVPRKMERHKIGGDTREAQVERVQLTVDRLPDLTWETEVGFLVEDWGMPFAGVLGVEGFLNRWVVTFNACENYFVVEEPESFNSRLPPDFEEEYERRDLGWRGP